MNVLVFSKKKKNMHTVKKFFFIVCIYLLQNYNIKINTSQSNLYKSLYLQMQARSQKMGRGSWGLEAEPPALEDFAFFGKNNLILGLF